MTGRDARALAGGMALRDMTAADIPAVHDLERRLFPVDAWPLQMFLDELAQA
ncbi:MAG: rimI, partial [Arthrobacter sp.]|nr:rimI [Arthrobacter sp.]